MAIKVKNILISFFLLFLAAQSLYAQKLQNRELVLFPQNFEVKHKCIFENDKPYLIIAVPAYNFRLSLKVYTDYPSKPSLIWQTEPEFRDSVTEQPHKIALDLSLKDFAVEIRVLNSNNQVLFHDLSYVSASDPKTQIYLTDVAGMPILNNYLKSEDFFKVSHNKEDILKFYVRYFPEKPAPAPPPASKNSAFFNPNSENYTQSFVLTRGRELKLSEEGIFYIQTDSTSKDGVLVAYFGEDFPTMTRVSDLVLATRYITKNEEYNTMKNAVNMKAALDEYWLARNKKEQEAKRLISLYYNRMKEANRRFTYAKEGWKTDMGMIFTIFGKPQIVRKYPDKTVWYYSHSNGRNPVEFVFLDYKGQYILDRSEYLKEPWNAEIMNWRLGRAN